MWTDDDCSVTKVTNYGFNIPAFIKCGELQTVMCIFQASSITVPEVLTSQAWRGTFMKTPTSWCSKTNTHIVLNMQILNRYACTKLCQLPEEKLLNIETLCKELHIQTPVQGNLSRYRTLGPLRAQLGTWGPLVYPQQSRPTWTSARCWRRPTGQGWPPCWDITSSRNVSSRWLVFYMWPVKCTVVIILLPLWADQVFSLLLWADIIFICNREQIILFLWNSSFILKTFLIP